MYGITVGLRAGLSFLVLSRCDVTCVTFLACENTGIITDYYGLRIIMDYGLRITDLRIADYGSLAVLGVAWLSLVGQRVNNRVVNIQLRPNPQIHQPPIPHTASDTSPTIIASRSTRSYESSNSPALALSSHVIAVLRV
jgi:hypothetical protein